MFFDWRPHHLPSTLVFRSTFWNLTKTELYISITILSWVCSFFCVKGHEKMQHSLFHLSWCSSLREDQHLHDKIKSDVAGYLDTLYIFDSIFQLLLGLAGNLVGWSLSFFPLLCNLCTQNWLTETSSLIWNWALLKGL